MRHRLVLVVALLLAGCAGEPPEAVSETARPTAGPATAAEARPGAQLDRILEPRDDDAAFLAGLRPPRSRTAEAVANRHDPAQTDSVVTMAYDGLAIEAYAVTGGPTFVRTLSVTDAGYGTSSGLSVDETRADIEAVLGAPTGVDGTTAVYDGATDPVTFVAVTYEPDEDGVERAAAIVWTLYLD